jgi:hypothetical protein
MGMKTIMDTTFSRGVYNKARKRYLDDIGEIHCARCPYHGVENFESKYYGPIWNRKKVRYPNWKLVSKNRKQWMEKPVKVKRKNYKYFEDYFELFF